MSIACSTSIRCNSPLEEALSTIKRLGFEKIDLLTIDGWAHVNTRDMADNWEPTVARVDRLLQASGLTPLALNSGVSAQLHQRSAEVNAQRIREIAALLRFARHYGVGIVAIQPRNADRSRPWQDVIDACIETLREQKQMGDAAGVTFALELHVHSPFETMEQARYLCERMPELPLIYDPTHFVMQGIPIQQTAWLLERAAHVHLRDAAPAAMQTHFGAGAVDFHWVLSTLKERGYQGHFSIEYLQSKDLDIVDDVRKLRETIARYFA